MQVQVELQVPLEVSEVRQARLVAAAGEVVDQLSHLHGLDSVRSQASIFAVPMTILYQIQYKARVERLILSHEKKHKQIHPMN